MTTVETIRTAGTVEEIKAVLLGSARVTDMAEAYQAVTGYSYSGRLRGISREEIASNMASQIMTEHASGFFRAKSVAEKYEEMKKLNGLPLKLLQSTLAELEEIAGMLEIEEETNGIESDRRHMSDFDKKCELEERIVLKLKEKKLEELKRAESLAEGREMLKVCDTSMLGELGKMVGSDFSERIAEAREEVSSREELVEWVIKWILERLGVGAESVPTEEEGGETEMETVNEAATPAETEAEEQTEETTMSMKPEIAFSLEGHTAVSLKNLVNTIYSRGSLMSKATGGDFRVSDKLVEELKEYGTTAEEVLRIIRSAGEEWLNGLKFEEDKVVFTGFPATEDAVKTHAYILLAAAINRSSLEQKHIQAKKVDESNEKFAFRVWLVRLGLNGAETKAERKTFYANLTGHTAFRTKEDEEKWYARRRAAASTGRAEAARA
ncbi:MAG: hypothetical protein IJG36_09355 [Synergistaceae bacterium]|nr:hypothetical protein [Synergistaceae bacterium]